MTGEALLALEAGLITPPIFVAIVFSAVFSSVVMGPWMARALARRTGIEVVSGHDGLLGDSLAPAGSPGDTYLTMMRHNATAIARNLR